MSDPHRPVDPNVVDPTDVDPTDLDPDDPLGGPLAGDDPLARHRPGGGPLDRVLALADATGVSPGRLVAGAVAIVAVAGAAAWSLRPPPDPPELDLPHIATTVAASPAAEGLGPDAPITTEPEATEVVVHVAGAVHSPGVHRLPVDARVVDAVAAAGGLAGDADEARVNLASPLADGERVYVPRQGEDDPPPPVAGGTPRAAGGPGAGPDAEVAPVDLNRATAVELEALPGVGPATAAAIVEHRDRVGGFTSVEQLLDVRGIGPAKLEQLRARATV